MFSRSPDTAALLPILVGLTIVAVFLLDVMLPLGIAKAVPYVAPVMLSMRMPGRRLEYVAGLCMVLTLVGAQLSPPGVEPLWMIVLNRIFALFAISLILLIGMQQRRLLSQSRRLQAVSALLERERVARDLHDGLAQVLGYVTATASTAAEFAGREQWDDVKRHVERLAQVAQSANLDVRQAIGGLNVSDALRGLNSPAQWLRWLADQEQVELHIVDLPGGEAVELSPALAAQAITILQEALRNVRKHSAAASAEACVTADYDWLNIELIDSGPGFEMDQVKMDGHYGLRTMRERAAAVGGKLSITSTEADRTRIFLQLPLHEDI